MFWLLLFVYKICSRPPLREFLFINSVGLELLGLFPGSVAPLYLVRFGVIRFGSVRSGLVWFGSASVWFRHGFGFGSVMVRFGHRFGSVWFGSVRFGLVRFGSVFFI